MLNTNKKGSNKKRSYVFHPLGFQITQTEKVIHMKRSCQKKIVPLSTVPPINEYKNHYQLGETRRN
jgi:hypothetical protein